MREVYDYKDIRRLEETLLNESIKEGIVIAATTELAKAMASYYPEYKVYSIHEFITAIIPEWQENVKNIKNYVMLRNVIENYIVDMGVREEVATYLRRNAFDIWNSTKLLIEADVYPDDIDITKSEPIKHFKNIWKKLEIENPEIMSFRAAFSFELTQRKALVDKIKSAVGELRENLFLFGFYFVTPIEERIFDVLETSQYNLKFVNCHNMNYSYATKIWEKVFEKEYASDSIVDIQENLSLSNYFGEALLGENYDIPIVVTKHHTEFDFAEMVKAAVDRGEVVYSPDAKQCEKILKEYYPEYYDQKHLLSYPVGQYVYYLHMMWNSFSNKMDLKFEYVFKCFATGWLSTEEINGRDYLYEMKVLEPYFKGCHSLVDWNNRLDTLQQAKEVVKGFDVRDKGDARWHKLVGNPFHNIGVYSIKQETIIDIIVLLKKLIDDATYLFEETEHADLYEHFQRITEIITKHMDADDLLNEECEIVNELLNQFKDESAKGVICPINGVRDAIVLLIGNHFGEYETQEEETSGKKRMVYPISMVEAAMLNNYGQKVHLVLANEFSMPGQPKKLPWPLTDDMLDELSIGGRKKTQKYVKDMRLVVDSRPLSYRYLFYTFMGISNSDNCPELSIEWICNKDKKDIDVSPYIKLLGVENQYYDVIGTESDYRIQIENAKPEKRNDETLLPNYTIPEEARMDYLVCKLRYYYSYLLNYLPSFTSEFQYSFELTKLISAFTILSGMDKNVVAQNLFELFPFLRHIELRQSTDFASSQGIPEPYEYENIEYPAQRLLTHFLNDDIIKVARKRNDEFLEDGRINTTLPEKACLYCPYSEICLARHKEEVVAYE